jgi:enoyl-CoA hydratase/carnithine racemase
MTAAAGEESRLLTSITGGVATFTLNRPNRLNAMDHGPGSLQRELVDALAAADEDPEVRCSIVTGAGRAFCSGGELGALNTLSTARDWYWFLRHEDEDNERIRQLRKPTIGALNGLCLGAGLIMAAHFDILVASDRATLGFIETRFGGTGVDVIAYHVGPQWAKFMALSGELLTARKAQEIGLVVDVIPHEQFEAKVADLGRRVASMPTQAVEMNRRVVNGAMDNMGWGSQKALALALNAVTNGDAGIMTSTDGRLFSDLMSEGWATFKEARDAPFREPWLEQPATLSTA